MDLKVSSCDHAGMAGNGDADIATIAAAVGQPARAAMLTALLGRDPLTVNELAARAGVAPATASLHLRLLADSGLVTGRRAGRTRRFELAGPDVARALESLQRLASPQPVRSLGAANAAARLKFARSCYDHLAGRLGVAVTDALHGRGYLRRSADGFALTRSGEAWLDDLGVDVPRLRRSRRGLALACLDWSERRPHVAGAVGAVLLERFLAEGWLERRRGQRALTLTARGEAAFRESLGVELDAGNGGR